MSVLEDTAAQAPGNQQAGGNSKPGASTASGNGSYRSRWLVDRWLTDCGREFRPKQLPNGTVYLLKECLFDPSHGSNWESGIFQRDDGMVTYQCMHNSCKGKTIHDAKAKIGKPDPQRHFDPPLTSTNSKASAGAGDESKPIEMNVITAAELDQGSFELKELVEGVLVAGQPAILAGMMKTLKTTILVALAVALVLGQKFLGVFNVPKAVRVGMVSCESGLAVLQETFRRICIAYGVALADLDGLFISDTIPRLENPAAIAGLAEFCRTNKLDVLILDPAYLMMSGLDAGNVFSMGEKLAALNILAADSKVTITLAHHLRKNRPGDFSRFAPPDLEEIAWSGFCEFARQWLLVGRRSAYEDGSGFHDLWLRVGGSAGHNSLWALDVNEGHRTDPGGRCWEIEVHPGGEVIQQAKQERNQRQQDKRREDDQAGQDAIVKALSTLPKGEGVFKFKLRAMTGISNDRLTRLLEQLADQKIIEPCQALRSPTHKAPQAGAYRLTDDWWNND